MYNDPNSQPPYGESSPYTSPYEQQYKPYPQQQYAQVPYGTPVYIQSPPPKSSNRTLWAILGIAGAVLLLVGGGCCAVVYFVVNSTVTKTSQTVHNITAQSKATAAAIQQTMVASELSPKQQASAYYASISLQDYSLAFDILAPHLQAADGTPLTLAKYTQEAQQRDVALGRVTDYTCSVDPAQPTHVAVQVTRNGGKTYTVHLTFTQGTFEWVISSFDRI
jgi:hypothetical protein